VLVLPQHVLFWAASLLLLGFYVCHVSQSPLLLLLWTVLPLLLLLLWTVLLLLLLLLRPR
jgi:hypothetical protein